MIPITNTYQGIVRKFLTRLSVRYAGAVTAVTENLKEAMMGHGLYNPVFVVIPNVVDTDFFTPSQSPAHAGKEKILLHVSCFEDKSKNISGILKAIHTLAQKRNDFHFLMVGEGQDLAAMITLAENLGISKKVTFTGLAEGSRLTGYFRQSLALVMFSHYENMPVVINESFSCGTPVIATRVGGIPEVVDESRGILVNPNDEPALCSAIETILDHPERFCNGDIRQYAVQHFGSEAIAAQFLSLYKTVIR